MIPVLLLLPPAALVRSHAARNVERLLRPRVLEPGNDTPLLCRTHVRPAPDLIERTTATNTGALRVEYADVDAG